MSEAIARPAAPIKPAQTEESLLSSVDPSCQIAESTSLVPQFPATYDPEWALKDPAFNTAPPRYKKSRKRIKAPKDSKIYKTVVTVLALKAQGHKTDAIAESLGITPHTVRQYMYTANRRGWLNRETFADPDDQLDIVLRSKSIRNLNTILDEHDVAENEETGERVSRLTPRAGTMSLEIAKGLGMLKTHTVEKGTVQAPVAMALSVRVEIPQLPGQTSLPTVRAGSSGGTPAFDAEIIGE